MSAFAARLFARLQDADWYRGLHIEAARALGEGRGKTWLDVGCGPGLLSRIAAEAGYHALGVDNDPDVIATARRLGAERGNAAQFEEADLAALVGGAERFDVVSASSLLAVLPDPAYALRSLVALTKPGGAALVIEGAGGMSMAGALRQFLSGRLGRRGSMLPRWAFARSGRTLDPTIFNQPGLRATHRLLLSTLVRASVVARA